MGFNQNSTFGFGSTGSGGGSTGTDVQVDTFVIGDPSGPVSGQSTFIVTDAIGGTPQWINLGNQQFPYSETGGDWSFDSGSGEVDISDIGTFDSGLFSIQYSLPTA